MRSTAALVLALCLFGGAPSLLTPSLLAQPPVPAGLQPGDHYHLIFVTSFTTGIVANTSVPPPFYPSWGGINAADYIINDTAANAGLIQDWNFTDVTWKAILSTPTVNAIDRVPITGPVYNTRGELVANDSADMWDGTLAHAIKYDESGSDIFSNFNVWTGTTSSGVWATGSCGSNWNDPTKVAGTGNLTKTNLQWATISASSGSSAYRLYGISPLLTVPQPGDYNGDGTANAADYVVWRHRGGPATDYDLWRAHFGESIPASGTATTETTAVPEPAAVTLVLVGVAILICVSERHSHVKHVVASLRDANRLCCARVS